MTEDEELVAAYKNMEDIRKEYGKARDGLQHLVDALNKAEERWAEAKRKLRNKWYRCDP